LTELVRCLLFSLGLGSLATITIVIIIVVVVVIVAAFSLSLQAAKVTQYGLSLQPSPLSLGLLRFFHKIELKELFILSVRCRLFALTLVLDIG
jgi:hypothetical protein